MSHSIRYVNISIIRGRDKYMKSSIANRLWLNRAGKTADKVEACREKYRKYTDGQIKDGTAELKKKLESGSTLDEILPEAYALACEAAYRVTGMNPYRVQIIGGIALHEGKVAEMKTGEGKTLVAVLPAYLNSLSGDGVHIVTVNDYLAKRDAENMGKIFEFLGQTVGNVIGGSSGPQRKAAYACDITYVTNTELGFDYLRDNMAQAIDSVVQRKLNYAIIDEVDSILIDEARTPLIISGEGTDVSKVYIACNSLAKEMEKGESSGEFNKMDAMLGEDVHESGDFIVHEKDNIITLTDAGIKKIEDYFHLDKYSDPRYISIQHIMELALRANYLMHRDKDYIVRDDEVLIVDTFTGRIMNGRQYSDGLHQAIEAKEGVTIKKETKTIATTTYQNFFNKYRKVCGMTGTAYTERKDFKVTYGLPTVVIPTNKPVIRNDRPDMVYLTKDGKFKGVLEEVKKSVSVGQPVLIGTASVRTSEELSAYLEQAGITHQVLNAKQDAHEAEIIAQAGIHGTVTIATNMAGRGTDIILDEEAVKAGGLKVIGTERHDAQRIDNQLRGRSGRQGDPGESVFYVSTDDDMVRLFGTDRFKKVLTAGGYDHYERIDSKLFCASIQKAQQRVEDNHFGMRKNVLDYDRVNDKQRELVYAERRKLLRGESVSKEMEYSIDRCMEQVVDAYSSRKTTDIDGIVKEFSRITRHKTDGGLLAGKSRKEIVAVLKKEARRLYEEEYFDNAGARQLHERHVMLASIDSGWMEQLRALDYLRQDINYCGYAQVDPKSQYAVDAFDLYEKMKDRIYVMATYAYFNYNPSQKKTEYEIGKVGA